MTSIGNHELQLRRLRNIVRLAAVLAMILGTSPALAQDHDKVRPSLVHIQLRGETELGTPLASEGTGFLISNDGYILTVRHLLDPLDVEGSVPEKVEIWVSIAEKKTSPDKRAAVVQVLEFLDLLLLKIPTSVQEYTAVSLGSTADLTGSGPVYTSGFATTTPYTSQRADIESRDGPGGYTWVLDKTNIDGGQSGSPVYDQNGHVVGLLKGVLHSDDRNTIIGSLFIPIEHADALLLPARFDELRELASRPARCRVCFKQGGNAACLGHQQSCSAWSDSHAGSSPQAPADEGWSGIVTVGAGRAVGTIQRCDLQWKIECE